MLLLGEALAACFRLLNVMWWWWWYTDLIGIPWRHTGCAEIGISDLFCSGDLDLDPMIFIYELDPDMQIWTYAKAYESYRLTDRQTDQTIENRPKLSSMPLHACSSQRRRRTARSVAWEIIAFRTSLYMGARRIFFQRGPGAKPLWASALTDDIIWK